MACFSVFFYEIRLNLPFSTVFFKKSSPTRPHAFGIVSVFTQALYFLVVQKLGVDKDFNALSIVYINSVSCTPLMLFFTFLYGESPGINTFEDIANPVFWINFISVVSFACIFSYSIFLSTTVNSALSTALVGVIKSALTTIIGMYTFGGVTATTSFVLGQMVNLGGGALYTYSAFKDFGPAPKFGHFQGYWKRPN